MKILLTKTNLSTDYSYSTYYLMCTVQCTVLYSMLEKATLNLEKNRGGAELFNGKSGKNKRISGSPVHTHPPLVLFLRQQCTRSQKGE